MKVKIKKLHIDAKVPTYGTEEAACFDICALHDGYVQYHYATTFSTGLAFEIPKGYAMLLYPRSGLAFKYGLRLANSVAVIDADYRGELLIRLHNDAYLGFRVRAGDRIAQARIEKVEKVEFELAEELSVTERGQGGIGSTGL